MKKHVVFLLPFLMLASCAGNQGAATGNGRIDCYYVRVTPSGSALGTGTLYAYQTGYTLVKEFQNEDGKIIYSDFPDSQILLKKTYYSSETIPYKATRSIGYLTVEQNYYLDLGSRTLDMETRLIENKTDENRYQIENMDNKLAYEKAKEGFYWYSGSANFGSEDRVDKSLERHIYLSIGQDATIEYRAKWF